MSASDGFPMTVTLKRSRREASAAPAPNFQRWLAECRKRGYRVYLAYDESHAWAEPKS